MKQYNYLSAALSFSILFTCVSPADAQESAPASEVKIAVVSAEDLASRKASLKLIEERIQDREQQINILVKDMESISNRLEERIAKIVSTLKTIKDSQNSKVRVAHMKQKTMKALYRTIEDFNRRRAELKEQLRTGEVAVGEGSAKKGVAIFDQKIEKRAEQMIELSKSFTEHVDYKKYEKNTSSSNSGYYGNNWGNGWENTRTSEKWKQNRRETVFTRTQRGKMIKALEKSIDDLERRNNTLSIKAKEQGVSDETKKFYQEDIARNEKALGLRRNQLAGLVRHKEETQTTSISQKRAHDTQLAIREIADDIRRDSNTNSSNYHELKQQLVSLNRIKLNLAARKEWLKNYEAAHGGDGK